MSANLESLAYVSNEENNRFVPWHGLGTPVEEAMTSEEAIKLAKLDWDVISSPVYANGNLIPGYKANIRSTDNACLGMVGERYKIVQNSEAFNFTDALLGEGCKYETAGSLDGGKRIFLLAKLDPTKILGDDVEPYVCFTNGHDGFNTIKACCTPIRVVCSNTLSFALQDAKRVWSTKHVGDLNSKMEEARRTLELANKYMINLNSTADMLANTTVTEEDVRTILDNLYPVDEHDSDRRKENIEENKQKFMVCMMAPDLIKFQNSAWQVAQAASDYATHTPPKRSTANFQERNFARVLDGNVIIDTVFAQLLEKAATGVIEKRHA